MNKKVIVAIVIVLIIIIGIVIFLLINNGNDNVEEDTKKVEVTIKITAGIPFKWVYEIEDENIIKYVKNYTLKDENVGGITGAPIYVNYVFEGINPGTTKVIFKYVSLENENDAIETKKFIMKVDEQKNISLVEE